MHCEWFACDDVGVVGAVLLALPPSFREDPFWYQQVNCNRTKFTGFIVAIVGVEA